MLRLLKYYLSTAAQTVIWIGKHITNQSWWIHLVIFWEESSSSFTTIDVPFRTKKEQKSGHVILKILVVQLVPPQRQQLLTILILEINTTLYISLQYYKVSLRRTTTFPGLISACSFTHLLRLILGLTKRRNNYFFSLYFCDDYKLNTQHTWTVL